MLLKDVTKLFIYLLEVLHSLKNVTEQSLCVPSFAFFTEELTFEQRLEG